MIAASTILCGNSDEHADLYWWGAFGSIVWGLLFPIIMFTLVALKKQKLIWESWWRQENSVLIIGYTAKCAWWEAIVFLDKFLIAFVAHMSLDTNHQILLQFLLVLVYGSLNVAYRPYDRRCHNVLWRVQISFIALRIFLCIALEFVLLTETDWAWISTVVVTVIANFAFATYIFVLLWQYGTQSFIQRTSN